MNGTRLPRILSIPPGVPFLPELADALLSDRLGVAFEAEAGPMALADVTIYVPTRRAARRLRAIFMERSKVRSAILPVIRPLGEFDEDETAFDPQGAGAIELAPPISGLDRLLHLADLARAWKRRLPDHVAARFDERVEVPVSAADAVWLARDLAALMDEIETEGADWTRLRELAPASLAGWWQVTLEFLSILTEHWPRILDERGQSNPAWHRNALIRLESERLRQSPPPGPVIAAGSTGSIPATAELLSSIARLPRGAVVLPGLDKTIDDDSWNMLSDAFPPAAMLGHPQFGLARLLRRIGILRQDIAEVGAPEPSLATRAVLVSEALRPAATTDRWSARRAAASASDIAAALSGVSLVEAPRERDEAAAIALALREAISEPGRTAALVTGDRQLARRVAAELGRFGIRADDSGGTPLTATPPGTLMTLLLEAALRPSDPVPVLALLKHPLLTLGLQRAAVRHAAETIELVALRGGSERLDAAGLAPLVERRLAETGGKPRQPFWFPRLTEYRRVAALQVAGRLGEAIAPLIAAGTLPSATVPEMARATVLSLEALARDERSSVAGLYGGEVGERLAEFLRGLVAATAPFGFSPGEWPDIVAALLSAETVKPRPGAERRIAIWGALEARLQSVDTLVIGGLNEGSFPRRAEADRFMSRAMKSGLELEPPERRIGQSAHDFCMALGTRRVVLTRSARAGETPSTRSRWLQRLLAFAGKEAAHEMRARGEHLAAWARELDAAPQIRFVSRPEPKPPLEFRPTHFSVTEIETLRRDPYAVYARRILKLFPLEPLLRDPGAAERGTLFHEILRRFCASGTDPRDGESLRLLLQAGRQCFAELALPADVDAVWWPRFGKLASGFIDWERSRAADIAERRPEARAEKTAVGSSGVTLSGYADRVDVLAAGKADILDYKTGSSPSKGQAHTLLAPQLALEGALLRRGAFQGLGTLDPGDLIFVRLKANGEVSPETILEHRGARKDAVALSEKAWSHLERLLLHYGQVETGYKSRALPFREGDIDGDYDHLARVLEWSAGGDDAEDAVE
jgi:ATP-dependent helicase/nuclease subunit B